MKKEEEIRQQILNEYSLTELADMGQDEIGEEIDFIKRDKSGELDN